MTTGVSAEKWTSQQRTTRNAETCDMAPGLMWHNGNLAVGANYIFTKTSETITAEELGITSGVYYAFIDKGMMYGVRDIWDNSSLHIRESGVSGFPSRELSHGAAAQFQWRNLYADAEVLSSHGSTGEKQKIWYNFSGWSFGAHVDYRIPAQGMSHYIRGSYAFRTQDNDENILEDVTENGVTTTRKYGANTIYTRQNIRARLEWEVLLDTGEYFNAGATWNQDREVSIREYMQDRYFRNLCCFSSEIWKDRLES